MFLRAGTCAKNYNTADSEARKVISVLTEFICSYHKTSEQKLLIKKGSAKQEQQWITSQALFFLLAVPGFVQKPNQLLRHEDRIHPISASSPHTAFSSPKCGGLSLVLNSRYLTQVAVDGVIQLNGAKADQDTTNNQPKQTAENSSKCLHTNNYK